MGIDGGVEWEVVKALKLVGLWRGVKVCGVGVLHLEIKWEKLENLENTPTTGKKCRLSSWQEVHKIIDNIHYQSF